MLAVDKLRALFQRAGMSAAESNAAVRNTAAVLLAVSLDDALLGKDALAGAFVWGDSPEGHAYWAGVHARLSGVRE